MNVGIALLINTFNNVMSLWTARENNRPNRIREDIYFEYENARRGYEKALNCPSNNFDDASLHDASIKLIRVIERANSIIGKDFINPK